MAKVSLDAKWHELTLACVWAVRRLVEGELKKKRSRRLRSTLCKQRSIGQGECQSLGSTKIWCLVIKLLQCKLK